MLNKFWTWQVFQLQGKIKGVTACHQGFTYYFNHHSELRWQVKTGIWHRGKLKLGKFWFLSKGNPKSIQAAVYMRCSGHFVYWGTTTWLYLSCTVPDFTIWTNESLPRLLKQARQSGWKRGKREKKLVHRYCLQDNTVRKHFKTPDVYWEVDKDLSNHTTKVLTRDSQKLWIYLKTSKESVKFP